ncbi:hypothetical protein DENSPDRAFT_841115 [Dentipellis sp. KUC8613]|nr:hypothetical protein DENSPDRAFT_841115 [Dentipellis sp. KUC8613]
MLPDVLQSLPVEIFVKIFELLDGRDISRCSLVCKFFSGVVKGSAELQYRIQLTIEGVAETEGMPTHSVVAERLETLLARRHGWNTMKWMKKITITYKADMPWYFSDGILLSMRRSSSHQLVAVIDQLPTRGSEDGSRTCIELPGLTSAPKVIAHDATQDLLVFVTRSDKLADDPAEWFYIDIHLRSLSTGATHPSAQLPRLECKRKTLHEHHGYQLGICGDVLVLLCRDPGYGGITISALRGWHWKTGDCFGHIGPPNPQPFCDFAFLTPDILLLSNPAGGQIKVLTTDFVHLLTLQLPSWGVPPEGMSISCSAVADSRISADALPNDRIVSVMFDQAFHAVSFFEPPDIYRMEITFRAQTVFQLLAVHGRRPPVDIPAATHVIVVSWDEWGPDACRMFVLASDMRVDYNSRRMQQATHGMRSVRTFHVPDRAQVLDFNVTRHMGTLGAGDPDANPAALITKPTILEPVDDGYQCEVVTKLPYAAIDIPNSEAYCGYLLDEQRLLGIKHRVEDRPDQEIDVFVF